MKWFKYVYMFLALIVLNNINSDIYPQHPNLFALIGILGVLIYEIYKDYKK